MTNKNRSQYQSLNKKEKKIYNSIIDNFKETSHESAYNIAIQGGVNWQFISK